MIKSLIKSSLNSFGYDIQKVRPISAGTRKKPIIAPPNMNPVWPLPRRQGGLTDQEIRAEFARYPYWHYGFEFEGGLSFRPFNNNPDAFTIDPQRPLQRFRHFMPFLIEAMGGTLKGKRILDIACNAGFWSTQCALLGANVVGFDARPELIEQANLVKDIVGLDNVEFRLLDFGAMTPATLGQFDVVLNLGILYHLPDPLAALAATKMMAQEYIVLDTNLWQSDEPIIWLHWENPVDIRDAKTAGVVGFPSKSAIEVMLRHIGVTNFHELPLHTDDVPGDYLIGDRATWLINVGHGIENNNRQ
jgi:SAM-dependent methyltransferase